MRIRVNENDQRRRLLTKFRVIFPKVTEQFPQINIPAKFIRSASEENRAILQTDYKHCFYCGYTPSGFDHFPPKKITTKGFLLPCCIQCNVIASNRFAFDIEKRILYIKERLEILLDKLPINNEYTRKIYLERINWNPRNFQIDFKIIKSVTKIISESNEVLNSIKNLKHEKVPSSIAYGKITSNQAEIILEPQIENDLFEPYLKSDLF